MERRDEHTDMTDIAEEAERERDDRTGMHPAGRDARPETDMAPEGSDERDQTDMEPRSG